MKNSRTILIVLIAAGIPGVALLTLTAFVSADLALAGLTTIGLFAFAIDDFARNTASLQVRAKVIRPPLHAAHRSDSSLLREAA